jgi:hypothetical protein
MRASHARNADDRTSFRFRKIFRGGVPSLRKRTPDVTVTGGGENPEGCGRPQVRVSVAPTLPDVEEYRHSYDDFYPRFN